MRKGLETLLDLQQRFLAEAEAAADENGLERIDRDDFSRLSVFSIANQLHVDFFGAPFDEPFAELLATLIAPEVADSLASLTFRGPDEGANGTRNWDITALVESGVILPRLRTLEIERTKPTDHNRTIVARDYEEDGVLAKLLHQSPALETLIVPSAPNAELFQIGQHPLRNLHVDAGYDTQGFIGNLASSDCFPNLGYLEFGEFHETYNDDYAARCTPLAEYEQLFRSQMFRSVGRFVWKDPACTTAEIQQLRNLAPHLQLLVVQTSAKYIR